MEFKRKHVAVFLCLVSVLSFLPHGLSSDTSGFLRYEVNDVFAGDLTQTIRVYNPSLDKVEGGKLLVPLIRNQTARHYAILANVSSPVGEPAVLNDGFGNVYAYWSNIAINGQRDFVVTVHYYLLSFSVRYQVNPNAITDYDRNTDFYKKYTEPEELVQSDNPEIVAEARDLTENVSNAQDKASRIYDFVVSHIRYAVQDEEKGALWALENGVGDCSEYSYLFVALGRAAGIPARIQAGFAFHSTSETLEDGHMWAEYYLEEYGWVPLDATWREFDALDNRHFSSLQSIPELTPYTNYLFNNTAGPEPDDEQTLQLKPVSLSVFGDNFFVQNTVKTVETIKQAKLALLLGGFFGAPLIFPSEARETRETLAESQIQLQDAMNSWEQQTQITSSNVAAALDSAEEAARDAWTLIVKTFVISIGILIVAALVTVAFMRRRERKLHD